MSIDWWIVLQFTWLLIVCALWAMAKWVFSCICDRCSAKTIPETDDLLAMERHQIDDAILQQMLASQPGGRIEYDPTKVRIEYIKADSHRLTRTEAGALGDPSLEGMPWTEPGYNPKCRKYCGVCGRTRAVAWYQIGPKCVGCAR